jgi:organic radical activating enzyme
MEKSNTYCVLTHVGVALQNGADYCCCNLNKETWKDNSRQIIRVYSHPLKTAVKSFTRKLLATALDRNIRHPSCRACWEVEDSHNESARMRFNKKFEHLIDTGSDPRVLIIKPGNTCNFACRMCNPLTSSSWYADGYELEKADLGSSSWYSTDHTGQAAALTFNEYTRTFEMVRKSFGSNNEEFWSTLKEWIPNLEYIDIYGGEPFLIPPIFDLLDHGITLGVSNHIAVNLHTNASIFNEQYADILTHYKHVGFALSIDSMDPTQFSYIRHKGNLETTITNLNKFSDFFQNHPNIEKNIALTINTLNVFYMDQIKHDLEKTFGLKVSLNIVTTPEYDIRHLPLPVKTMLINTLQDQRIVEFLKNPIPGCDIEWPKFCRATDKLDQLRNQSFADAFPEWWEILEPYWVK